MPVFQTEAWGQEEAFQAALKHYGINQSGMPDDATVSKTISAPRSNMKLTEGTGMPLPRPQRKPLPPDNSKSGHSYHSRPDPKGSATTDQIPFRAPVASPSPVPGISSPRTQSPDSKIKKIYRTEDGKFDPSTITGAGQSRAAAYAFPASSMPTPTRPSSRSSNRPEMKRTDSNASTSSWRVRRDSVTRLARRLSDAFKDTVDIMKMDRHERRDFVRTKYDEAEDSHRQSYGSPSGSQTASSAHLSTSSVTPSERLSKPSSGGSVISELPSKPKPGNLSKGEKFAIGVSKAVDPLKPRGRSATNDSDMSFGLTDLAPESALMEPCSECARPTFDYLINGLCKQCHALEVKVAKEKKKPQDEELCSFTDPWQFPQGRATWPDVHSPEHGYMKLPSKRKITKIRQTVYEDMGNPFADETEFEAVSPDTGVPDHAPHTPTPLIIEESSSQRPLCGVNGYEAHGSSNVLTSASASLVDSVTVPPHQGSYRSAHSPVRMHRRSKSLALPFPRILDDLSEYVAPRTLWRKDSAPTDRWSPENHLNRTDVRDTRFYGFYHDIFEDYKEGRSKM